MLLAALYLRLPEQTAWLIGRVWSLLVITCLLVFALWAAGRAGLLPLVMVCLFSLLLGLNRGERRSCRKLSSLIYVLHPWCIVLVRGGAEVLGLEGPLVENSMGHFLAVLASSAAASWVLWLAWSRRPLKRSNKG